MTDRNEGGDPDPTDNADVPPVLPSEQPSGNNGGGVLSPDELDFTESPYVAEVSDSRYVVSADHSPPDVPEHVSSASQSGDESAPRRAHADGTPESSQSSRPESSSTQRRARESDDQSQPQPQSQSQPRPQSRAPDQARERAQPPAHARPPQSPEQARSILASELERTDARLALDIVSQFGSDTIRHRTASDDVVGTFDNLVLWYAQHVARKTPTMRTASLLFSKSEFSPALTKARVRKAAADEGLDESDTIGDLLERLE